MVTILRCRRSRVGEWAVSDPCPPTPNNPILVALEKLIEDLP